MRPPHIAPPPDRSGSAAALQLDALARTFCRHETHHMPIHRLSFRYACHPTPACSRCRMLWTGLRPKMSSIATMRRAPTTCESTRRRERKGRGAGWEQGKQEGAGVHHQVFAGMMCGYHEEGAATGGHRDGVPSLVHTIEPAAVQRRLPALPRSLPARQHSSWCKCPAWIV